MALVYISLGSNINREKNIRQAEVALAKAYGELEYSPIYETEAVGFDGDNFYNSVIALKTEDSVYQVAQTLKDIEDSFGRDRTQPKFSARVIDLDLLLYDDMILKDKGIHIPREEILYNAFVLKSLVDIAATLKHPELNKSIETIWLDSELKKTVLTEVVIDRS